MCAAASFSVLTKTGNKVGVCVFDVWQLPTEKGMSFTTDEDVLGEKAQNQYVLCLWGE